MTGVEWQARSDLSLFAMGTTLLRSRWRIVRWMVIGAVIAFLSVASKPILYVASASFVTQGSDLGRSGLASLAGQFGVSLSSGSQGLSPDFYSELVKSRVLLLPLTLDTLEVAELGGKRVQFADLFELPPGPAIRRQEQGVGLLRSMVTVRVDKTTGVIGISVATPWRSVSLALSTAIVNGVNDFNERLRQGQAAAERKFVEGRLAVASADLSEAERRLEHFLRTNRDLGSSAQLIIERERIQRELTLRQEVFTSLMQSYEDARIREVRDTPVISIFEPPSAPTQPEGRGRLKRVMLGLLLGALVAVLLIFTSDAMTRQRNSGGGEATEFLATLDAIKRDLLRPVRLIRNAFGR